MYNYEEMGKRVEQARKEKDFTREKLSEMLDITPRFLYDIESGKKGISVGTLMKIARMLDLSIDYLLFGHEYTNHKAPDDLTALIDSCPESKKAHLYSAIKMFIRSVNNTNSIIENT